jgi:site-specific DNA-cytosine methylase
MLQTSSAISSTIELSIQRLEDIVDQETAALKTRKAINLKDFNDRKSQALLELTRMLRTLQGGPPNAIVAERVQGLKSKLAVNQAVLKLHLEAVREISTSLADAIRHSESDGTYTPSISSLSKRA